LVTLDAWLLKFYSNLTEKGDGSVHIVFLTLKRPESTPPIIFRWEVVNRILSIPSMLLIQEEVPESLSLLQSPSIRIHILTEQANLLHTHLRQVLHFFNNLSTGSALLLPLT